MDQKNFPKAAIFTVVNLLIGIICWEFYLRKTGNNISFDDGPALWSEKRDEVYKKNATVFIGSSRIKYDLDIETWESITGEEAVQLAMEGTSPRPILENLANDEDFKGKLIIDITEVLFFSKSPGRQHEVAANLDFYKNHHTPAQRAGFSLNNKLEAKFVFLDKEAFSLAALLSKVKLPPRQGVFSPPAFPVDFNRVTDDRQSYMTDRFVANATMKDQVKAIWASMGQRREPPPTGDTLTAILQGIKGNVDKIKARGGTVLFVRTPSSGPFKEVEGKAFPRERYWDQMLAFTNTPGIHYMDYSAIDNFECPEFSHLSKNDAVLFTKEFIRILQTEMNWNFPSKQTSL